jgi:hypothetical protein
MTEKLLNQQVLVMARHLENLRGVPMGVSDKLLLRNLAKEKADWLSKDPNLNPEEAVLDGAVMAMNEFPSRYR